MENKVITIEKKEKGSYVQMDEIIKMKVLDMMEMPIMQIAKKLGRNWKTVKNCLVEFENLLPGNEELVKDVMDDLAAERTDMINSATRLRKMADAQVMRKIYDVETKAVEAAKISQMYGSRASAMAGLGDDSGKGKDLEKSPKVVQFINNFIIKPNDNLHKGNTSSTKKDGKGGNENIIEGVVSE